ncbi:MAG: histidine kinase [Deltaproteobacteria bacterium]|nr:histidine kinase [Deltaproteobacteria bacterium]
MKRYVRWSEDDERALRALGPRAESHFPRIAEEFYDRLSEHEGARRVLEGARSDQVARLKGTLREWLSVLLTGPWDERYFERRARIGRVHVQIGLPQRYMFGAMNLIRTSLAAIAMADFASDLPLHEAMVRAIGKVLDLELAIMVEAYHEALVQEVRQVERSRTERLASLGTMAAGLAHEIRNPLNAAHLQLALVQRRLGRPSGPDVRGALAAADLVSTEMTRLAMLVEEFLQFARPHSLKLESTDLRCTAEEVVALLAPEAVSAGIQLSVEGPGTVPAILDHERMKQVILNLLRNAIEAVGSGGRVRVTVGLDGEPAAHAHLDVEDDGPGLPSGDTRIFEPFFTTKPGGTGLGLAVVHRIVSEHGGRVAYESRPGHTVFRVSLPAPA